MGKDGLVTMIIDILRRKQEEAALNQGGAMQGAQQPQPQQVAPVGLPRGIEPKHGGKTYDDIVTQMGG